MIARPPRWLIAAILVDGAALATLIARGFGILPATGESILLICAAFAFAIYAGVGLTLWLRPSPQSYGRAIGLYIVGVMIVGGWLALLALGLGMSSTLSGDDMLVLGRALGLLVAQLVLSALAYRAAGRAGVESRLDVAVAGVLQLNVIGALSASTAVGLGLFVDRFVLSREARGFDALQGAVYRIEGCAAQYAHAHPDIGYPSSLAAMGSDGERCLDERTVAGRDRRGVAIEYVPVLDGHNRVISFLVTAIGRGFSRVDTLSGDPAGLAVGRGAVQWGKSLHMLSFFRNCLALYRASFPTRAYPDSLVDLVRALEGRSDGIMGAPLYGGCRFTESGDRRPEHERVEERVTMHHEHHLTYRPNGPYDYLLELRPVRYGETAVRSYMMRSDDRVHFTLLDRSATEDDPEIRSCEYDERDQATDCIFLPGPPPAAALVHDTVIVRGSRYLLAARNPDDPASPPDPSLRFDFDCDATSPLGQSLPQKMADKQEEWCHPMPDWRGPAPIVVRLWVMDRSGATSVQEDTVPVVDRPMQAVR